MHFLPIWFGLSGKQDVKKSIIMKIIGNNKEFGSYKESSHLQMIELLLLFSIV